MIDEIDLSRNDPAVDLTLFWSTLGTESRGIFLDAYGQVTEQQLLRARVLSLFLRHARAFGHHEGLPALDARRSPDLDRA